MLLIMKNGPIPLNARRLTLSVLRQIGEALALSATNAELKLMVEGRLTEMGYDPANVQVTLMNQCILLMMKAS